MKIETIGRLRTLKEWENFLAALPDHAEGAEGLGRMWMNEDAPRATGQDPTVKTGWRLAVVPLVNFCVPEDAEVIVVSAENSATGKPYTLVRIDRTVVHIHSETPVKFGDDIVGTAQVCARVIWPKGAEERSDGTTAWRNYILYVDFYLSTEPATSRLVVLPSGSERLPLIMLGVQCEDGETGNELVVWATRSANWKPPRDGHPSVGSDQAIVFESFPSAT